MSDDEGPGPDDVGGHPSARHLRAAPEPSGASRDPSTFPFGAELPLGTISYGPDIADEATLRLLGHPESKRILVLGAGTGQAVVSLALAGARAICVEPDLDRLHDVRALAEAHEVKVELHHGDLADLAFLRADTVDAALSIYALAGVDDLDRVFRQVHRVLSSDCPLVCSLPHPAFAMLDPAGGLVPQVSRRYGDRSPRPTPLGDQYPRTVGDLFTGLSRANFRVDVVLEPEPLDGSSSSHWVDAMGWVPATLILRARKLGI